MRLAFLAPDIVAAILAGKRPAGLTANKLMADTRLPLDWRDQRVALGSRNPIVHPLPFDPWLEASYSSPREASTVSARLLSSKA